MFSNPKRNRRPANSKELWFDYYAGYSPDFVRTVLRTIVPDGIGTVLDPWNGSGTTTATASELGINSMGVDINPVMTLVAKAKAIPTGVESSLLPIAKKLVESSHHAVPLAKTDPLRQWFARSGAQALRHIELSIRHNLTQLQSTDPLYTSTSLEAVSSLAAFFFVALFRTTRSYLHRFQASNPTWMKSPDSSRERARPNPQAVFDSFLGNVELMVEGIKPFPRSVTTSLLLGSSEKLPIPSQTVHAVVASPPYCTRIDYAVATKPELAVLGLPMTVEFENLRRQMIGTIVVNGHTAAPEHSWGRHCLAMLDHVKSHPSKGSANYYHKLLAQYYGAMQRSLLEIDRTLREGGHCVLVVQDSHYKEVHIDVATHVVEMVTHLGWSLKHRVNFESRTVMARINPKARKYRPKSCATESVLWFRTAS